MFYYNFTYTFFIICKFSFCYWSLMEIPSLNIFFSHQKSTNQLVCDLCSLKCALWKCTNSSSLAFKSHLLLKYFGNCMALLKLPDPFCGGKHEGARPVKPELMFGLMPFRGRRARLT